jgi:hypothetical protein
MGCARPELQIQNHTRNINLLAQLLNPKFALRAAPR